jgi:hypothetical protein
MLLLAEACYPAYYLMANTCFCKQKHGTRYGSVVPGDIF